LKDFSHTLGYNFLRNEFIWKTDNVLFHPSFCDNRPCFLYRPNQIDFQEAAIRLRIIKERFVAQTETQCSRALRFAAPDGRLHFVPQLEDRCRVNENPLHGNIDDQGESHDPWGF
jgi:hypothetical protein